MPLPIAPANLPLLDSRERSERRAAAALGILGGLATALVGGVVAILPWGRTPAGLAASWWLLLPGAVVPALLGAAGFFLPVFSGRPVRLGLLRAGLRATLLGLPLAAAGAALGLPWLTAVGLVPLALGGLLAAVALVPAVRWGYPPQAALGAMAALWGLLSLAWAWVAWARLPLALAGPWVGQAARSHFALALLALPTMLGVQMAMGARLPSRWRPLPEWLRLAGWWLGAALLAYAHGRPDWRALPWAAGILLAVWAAHGVALVRLWLSFASGPPTSRRTSAEGFVLGWAALGAGLVLGLLMGLEPARLPHLRSAHLHLNLMAGIIPIVVAAATHLLDGPKPAKARATRLAWAVRAVWLGGVLFSLRALHPSLLAGGALHLLGLASAVALMIAGLGGSLPSPRSR